MAATDRFRERDFQSADGLRLYFRDYASSPGDQRPAIVCLPGLTRNSRDFERLAPRLSALSRVICPDLRGRGNSDYDPDWRNYNPAQYVVDLAGMLNFLGLGRVRLIGTSLGGLVSMLLADNHPDLVDSVVLNDIGPEIDPSGLARVVASAGTLDRVDTFDAAIASTRDNYGLAFPDWSETDWHRYTQTTYRRTESGDFDLNYDRGVGEAIRAGVANLPGDPWTIFDALTGIPTMLVMGELSDILTPAIAGRMRIRKPDLQIVTVSNRGHAPTLEEPKAYDAISKFLSRC